MHTKFSNFDAYKKIKIKIQEYKNNKSSRLLSSRVGVQKLKKHKHNVFPKPNMFVFVRENKN